MQQLHILVKALDYIEEHLSEQLKTDDIAKACFCSKSSLENIFRCLNNISVHDYVIRRKMTFAAKSLLENRELTVLDVAVMLGYSSNEAFTRAFHSVWNDTPSHFRRRERTSELFPKYVGYVHVGKGNAENMKRKNIDISELYDLFIERRQCYFVCCDIQNLIGFNEISRKAGDLAILETLNRMESVAGEADYVFRIGADEFVMVTDSTQLEYANEIKENILRKNGETFLYENRQLPLAVYCSVVQLDGDEMRYKDLFDKLHETILESKTN